MAAGLNHVLKHLRKVAAAENAAQLSDRQLVARFAADGDETAFAALVHRHGGMVRNVCWRVLQNDSDADDACQATFIVLARKASLILKKDSVASWLHGVAYRAASNLRKQIVRRLAREGQVASKSVPKSEVTWREVQTILDEEIQRLPEELKGPVLLCYLEGKAHNEGAQQLGWSLTTFRGRLERARDVLRKRLTQRGVALSGALLATVLSEKAVSAAVSGSFLSVLVKGALEVKSETTKAVVSAHVLSLAQGVMQTMFWNKLKIGVVALVVAVVAAGIGGLGIRGLTGTNRAQASAVPILRDADTPTWMIGAMLQGHGDKVWEVAFSPDGKRLASSSSDKSVVVWDVAKRQAVHTLTHSGAIHSIAFAPNGKTLATASGYGNEDYLLNLWEPETGKEQAVLKGHTNPVHGLSFSRDGKILVSANGSFNFTQPKDKGDVFFWDLETKKKIATLKCERVHMAILSHDGKKLVTGHADGTVKLWDIDEKFAATRETVIVQGQVTSLRVSPNGKAFVTVPVTTREPTIDLWDFETGKILQSFEHKKVSVVRDVAFAPDGKTLATGCQRITKKGDGYELAGEVKFWDVATGKEKQALRERLGPVHGLAFSPDGKTLAVGLLHKENVKLKTEEGGFVAPADGYGGVVVFCELKKGKPSPPAQASAAAVNKVQEKVPPEPKQGKVDDGKEPIKDKKVLTPEQIFRDKVEGPVRIEFIVKAVTIIRNDGAFAMEEATDRPAVVTKDGDEVRRLQITVTEKVESRLKQLGIEHLGTHFFGKSVRVSGNLKRVVYAEGGGTLVSYRLFIENLEQLEFVGKKL